MDELKADTTRTGRVIEERKCQICGWEWFPKEPDAEPGLCPRCKSTRWRIGRCRAIPRKKSQAPALQGSENLGRATP